MSADDRRTHRPGLSPALLSLSRRGAWGHIIVALILITVLPLLTAGWLWWNRLDGQIVTPSQIALEAVIMLILTALGYGLLIKYPVSITRLRRYLQTLSDGKLPGHIALTDDEDDLAAVQRYLEKLVSLAEERIRLLEIKHQAELDSERHRVMVESIGAMCHHLGQPATVMSLCLYRLKNNPDPRDLPAILTELEASFDAMTAILDQLRAVPAYRSEPYLPPPADEPAQDGDRILTVHPAPRL